MTTALLLLASSALLNAGDTAPSGTDIPTYINAGHYDFVLGGDSLWQSQVSINSAAKAGLNIDGNFNTIAMRTGHISLFRDFSYNNNTVALRNAIIRPDASYSAQSDYLIGFATQNITSKLNLSGTTFRDFNRADNRGATIPYAYADGATINLYGGYSSTTALSFNNNRSSLYAAGSIPFPYTTQTLDGLLTLHYSSTAISRCAILDHD